MIEQLLRCKLLDNLEVAEDNKELHFKLTLDSIAVDTQLIIYVPDFSELSFNGTYFTKDSIDKIVIKKYMVNSTEPKEKFSVQLYMGKLRICICYVLLDLHISFDRYRNYRFENLEDWAESYYKPVLLELEVKK